MSDKEYKPERVTFMSSKELIEAMENYQFDNRIQGRSETIRQLIEIGLEQENKK